jgi:L-iditol 2-dehydrogenase
MLNRPGEIVIADVPIPHPGPGEIVLRLRSALTCGTDLKAFFRGHPKMPMPTPLGHEFAGEIEAVGEGVRDFTPGDAIMAVHTAPCGNCWYCQRGRSNLCPEAMAKKVLGAYGEFILLPAPLVLRNVFPKPAAMSFSRAALLEPLACVVHGMRQLSFSSNDRILIIGDGAIGLLHILVAKEKGGRQIFLAGKHANRLEIGQQLGAQICFEVTRGDLRQAMREWSDGRGADFVFECTGRTEVWEESVEFVTPGGTVILFGGCPSGTTVNFDTGRLHYDEITLGGAFHFTPTDVFESYLLLCNRHFTPEPIISGSYSLDRLPEAFAALQEGRGVKYEIVM